MSSNKLRSQKRALQHLQAIIEAEQGSATPREGVASSIDRLVRRLEYERSRGSGEASGTWTPLDQDFADLSSRPKQFRCYRALTA